LDFRSGDIVQGRIAEVKDFGAFVLFEDGRKGLIRISELGSDLSAGIHSKVRPNQTVRVKILSISPDGKIECSLKQAESSLRTPPTETDLEPDEPAIPVPSALIDEPPELTFDLDQELLSRDLSFEEMLKIFKRMSEENLVDVKRRTEAKRSGGKKKKKLKKRKQRTSG